METKTWACECKKASLGTVVSLLFALLVGLSACAGGSGGAGGPLITPVRDGGIDWKAGATGTLCDVLGNTDPATLVYVSISSECLNHVCIKPLGTTVAYCAGDCTQDSDCVGPTGNSNDPLDPYCKSRFSCVIAMDRGPLCCRKLCLCSDFVTAAQLQTPAACIGNAAATCS